MNRLSSIFALVITLSPIVHAGEFHVAPNGSDTNPGTATQPFATLEKARDTIREFRLPYSAEPMRTHGSEAAIQNPESRSLEVITLAGGTYRLTKTFELNEKDSHTIYRAYPGADVRIAGSVLIPNAAVKTVTDKATLDRLQPEVRGKVMEIDLRALGITDFGDIGPRGFRRPYIPAPLELIVDGTPLDLARWPDAGQPGEPMGKVIDKGPVSRYGDKPTRGGVFEFKTDRPKRWTQADEVWITGLFENGYADNTVKVKTFDLAKKTLTTVQPHMYGFGSGNPWNRWTALNLLEEISVPGEYMADKKSGKLYFLPALRSTDHEVCRNEVGPPGNVGGAVPCRDRSILEPAKDNRRTECASHIERQTEISILKEPLIALEGATNVVFDGITFENARGMGVYIERGANCRIQNATLRNLGMVAISIGKGIAPDPNYRHAFTGIPVSRALGSWHEHIYNNPAFNRDAGIGHGIVNCSIYNIGAGAISMGGGDRTSLTPAGNFVENCDIHHFNRWDRTYKAGVIIDGVGNVVRHCRIHDCPAVAIYLHGNDHRIERNEIFNAMTEGDDMGAFYMGRDPSERGTVILNNYWHDIGRGKIAHSTNCIYFDDAGGDATTVMGNIFRRAGSAGVVFVNSSSDVTIAGNIFIDCSHPSPKGGKGEVRKTSLFEDRLRAVAFQSPAWAAKYPDFQDYLDARPSMPRRNVFINNLVIGKEMKNPDITFAHNRFTTDRSMFSSVEPGTFALKPGVDLGLPGFIPIPFNTIAGLDGQPVGKTP